MAAPDGLRAATEAARELKATMRGRVLMAGDEAYDTGLRLWNGAVERRPAVLARCADPADVQAAVRIARAHELPLSVRGGGHDWAGRALRQGGLVIDLSEMRQVTVHASDGIASAGGGATAGGLVDAAGRHGLVTASGSVGKVGMAGLTLGGGYGPLDGRFGLALDNLVSADVVLADGRQVTASDTEDADLLWALRGSGGNFGVLTGARYRLHPLASVLAGLLLYPLSNAAAVLNGSSAMLAGAPDELSISVGFLGRPDGPVLFLFPTWSGEPAAGEPLLAEVQRLGTPLSAQVGPMPYAGVLGLFDQEVVDGRHYWIETRWLPTMTESAVDVLVAAAGRLTSPFSMLNVKPFHGAAARVPSDATAFALRRDHLLVEIVAAWEPAGEPAADGRRHVDWARRTDGELSPLALPGGYPNLLAPDEHDRSRLAYGGNATRLLQLERRYDPDMVFASAVGIASTVQTPLTPRARS
jgi:hypothetical protein